MLRKSFKILKNPGKSFKNHVKSLKNQVKSLKNHKMGTRRDPADSKWVPDRPLEAPNDFVSNLGAILGDLGRPKGGHFWSKIVKKRV